LRRLCLGHNQSSFQSLTDFNFHLVHKHPSDGFDEFIELNQLDFGYFCGLLLGDGSIANAVVKRSNPKPNWTIKYNVRYLLFFTTSEKSTCDLFVSLARRLGSRPYARRDHGRLRRFPNGRTISTPYWSIAISSKLFYNALRPFKLADSHWIIPDFLRKEGLRGFLQGIFDAEGSCASRGVLLYSKHGSNLEQVARALNIFGIQSYVRQMHMKDGQQMWQLSIYGKEEIKRFIDKIGFRFERKQKLSVSESSVNPLLPSLAMMSRTTPPSLTKVAVDEQTRFTDSCRAA